ncbi:t-SNARE [Coniella lustricola]|uniref:t-SNARE n=1 Tax=Coniella lustricola TaxID=2025994 RepID=A0A2T3AAQ0_9PEZI|nr:t-SNARE [Coniella lustricola]
MAPLAQGAASPGGSPVNVLNEISDINLGLERIKQNLNQLRMLQDRSLNETDSSSGTSRQVDDLSATTMADYRGLVQRVRELKSNRDAQTYKGQVDRVDRALKDTIQQYQQVEADFRRKMQGQMERQYRIVRPDADTNEVRAAVEDMSAGGQQVFQQAMMQSNRQGQARAVLNEVQNRHQELLKIEQQMTELAQLIQDLDTLIIQQEPMVQQIDEHVEKTHVDLKEANTELDTAVETVRATRKKKWICCGIVALIIVIIVVAIVAWYFTAGPGAKTTTTSSSNTNKRNLELASMNLENAARALSRKTIAGRYVVPAKGVKGVRAVAQTATLPVALGFDAQN